jgi:fatty acid desaturase
MLRYKADRRTLAFVTAYFVLVALAYATDLPWWGSALLCGVLCVLSFFCAVITHNTVHTPVFKKRSMNRVFHAVLSLTYGHPVSMYVPGHNLSHHKYLQTPKDRMRTEKLRFRWNLLNQLFFMAVVGPPIFRDNAEYAKLMKAKGSPWYRQFVIELTVYVLFLVGTLAASVWLDGGIPWRFLVFVMLPHQYAAWGIMGINFVQHDGCEPGHAYNHSRNFTGKLINWFTFNNGYHGIHHEHPALHWSLAPEVHAKEYAPHIDPRLDQTSLLAYCWKAYVWPGKRVRFDGAPVVLSAPVPDEAWVPAAVAAGDPEEGASEPELGAAA